MNGILTSEITTNDRSRSFLLEKAPKFIVITCLDSAESEKIKLYRQKYGTAISLQCPRNCLKLSGQVFGTDIFATTSRICQAAIFAGAISDELGGIITIIFGGAYAVIELNTRNTSDQHGEQ